MTGGRRPAASYFGVAAAFLSLFAAVASSCNPTEAIDSCPVDSNAVGSLCSIEARVCGVGEQNGCADNLVCENGNWTTKLDCGSDGGGVCVSHCSQAVTEGATPCPGSTAEALDLAFTDCVCMQANCGATACSAPCNGSSTTVSASCNICAGDVGIGACKASFDACVADSP